MAQSDGSRCDQGFLPGPYNSLLNKMKRSVYNTMCWNPVDSETNLNQYPRVNMDFLPNTDIFVEYFKKAGDFLKESSQTRSKSKRKKSCENSVMLIVGNENCESASKQRKKSDKNCCESSPKQRKRSDENCCESAPKQRKRSDNNCCESESKQRKRSDKNCCELESKQRKRSAFSAKNTEERLSAFKDMDKFNRVLLDTKLGNQNLDQKCKNNYQEFKFKNQNLESKFKDQNLDAKFKNQKVESKLGNLDRMVEMRRKECYGCEEKTKEKGGQGEGENETRNDEKEIKTWNENKNNSRHDKTNHCYSYKIRETKRRCKQIYELSDDLCRNFKEKGYVKVNVKVKPDVSFSDFNIIIRRNKTNADHRQDVNKQE